MKKIKYMYWFIFIKSILNNIGNNNVNSISYNIKKTANKIKFRFIWIFKSERDLKPHSQKCLLLVWFFTL